MYVGSPWPCHDRSHFHLVVRNSKPAEGWASWSTEVRKICTTPPVHGQRWRLSFSAMLLLPQHKPHPEHLTPIAVKIHPEFVFHVPLRISCVPVLKSGEVWKKLEIPLCANKNTNMWSDFGFCLSVYSKGSTLKHWLMIPVAFVALVIQETLHLQYTEYS